jgi:ABC-2 type transport system ATP-binding protein
MHQPTSQPAVEVRDLVKRYGDVTAVAGLTFSLEPGKVTALLGGNGAGKTTTIAMLLGLVVPTSGDIRVLGEDMVRHRSRVLHRMNFESPYVNLPMRLTVKQNLKTFARLYGVRDPGLRIAELAEHLRLEAFLSRPAGTLSAGQKTRVSLAKSLINWPELLLLDEPTASLDPDTADWVRETLRDYAERQHATILLASHNMNEVERMASRVIMLDRGRIVEDGTPQAIIARYGRENLEEVFIDIARGNGRADGGPGRATHGDIPATASKELPAHVR